MSSPADPGRRESPRPNVPHSSGPNPLGHADHAPFTGFANELVYGERPDGSRPHVSAVPSGLRCDCVCPACKRVLVARKGTVKIAHFAHHGQGNGCGRAVETNAHMWAKEVLERELTIRLPEVGARIGGEELTTYGSRMFEFASARLEAPLHDIVPDVILTTKDGRRLLIEVLVTHACGPEKIAKLQERALPTIEVDLSRWRNSSDRAAIEAALISEAPREWLFNRRIEDARTQLEASIAARQAAAAEAARKAAARAEAKRAERARAERAAIDAAASKIIKAVEQARRAQRDADSSEVNEMELRGWAHQLWPSQPNIGFRIPTTHWQAQIIAAVVDIPIDDRFLLPHITIAMLMRMLEPHIHPLLRRPIDPAIWAALPDTLRGQSPPAQAIEDFLHSLCDDYYLRPSGAGGFEIAKERACELEAAHAAWQLRERRRCSVDQLMERILKGADPEDLATFRADDWRGAKLPGFDMPLDAIIAADEAVWRQFSAELVAIERMINGGTPVEQLLGLPLSGARARASERQAALRKREAHERELRLRGAARDRLDGDGDGYSWLSKPLADGQTPLALAAADEAGFSAALEQLQMAGRERERRLAGEALALRLRDQLQADAERDLGADLARSFMSLHDSMLGTTPAAACTSERGLRLGRMALAKWVERRRRATRKR